MGTRLVMDTLSCLIAKEADPSRLVAQSPGKLVRQLVANGEHVAAGQPYAEVEVMKMIMPQLCPAAGAIHFSVNEGAALAAGELIARMELDDPSKVKRAEKFTGTLPPLGPPQVYSDRVDHRFTQSLKAARMIMAGACLPACLPACSCLQPCLSLLPPFSCPPPSHMHELLPQSAPTPYLTCGPFHQPQHPQHHTHTHTHLQATTTPLMRCWRSWSHASIILPCRCCSGTRSSPLLSRAFPLGWHQSSMPSRQIMRLPSTAC